MGTSLSHEKPEIHWGIILLLMCQVLRESVNMAVQQRLLLFLMTVRHSRRKDADLPQALAVTAPVSSVEGRV